VSGYTAGEKVWHSTNGGQTWLNETQTGLPNLPCNAVVLDSVAGGIYVGMDAGIYYKKIGQAAWQNFSDGLPNASVHELEIAQKGQNASDRRILAATFGRGVWRSTLWGETTPVSKSARAPVLSRLSAVRSGNILRVSFQVGDDRPAEGTSTLKLHAANGALIHEEAVPNTGAFERDIPLTGKAQGIFWFTLEGPGGRVSRRIALY
jgi:ligand-binding sensor domain-containing protein